MDMVLLCMAVQPTLDDTIWVDKSMDVQMSLKGGLGQRDTVWYIAAHIWYEFSWLF